MANKGSDKSKGSLPLLDDGDQAGCRSLTEDENHANIVADPKPLPPSTAPLSSPQPADPLLPSPPSDPLSPPPVAPDGGWGWVVVAACVVGHFFLVGTARTFGVFYVVLLEKFEGTAQATAWAHALCNTIRMLSGPIVSRLCERYTCRKVVIIGGILQGFGYIISGFATSLVYLYFSYGVLTGIGGALVFTPMLIILSHYFEKKKGKAMALATLGSGLGSVVLAPLSAHLLREYSWTGAMLVTGALMFHNSAVGTLFRPLPKHSKQDKIEMEEIEKEATKKNKCSTCLRNICRTCRQSEGLKLFRSPTYLLYCLAALSLPFIAQLTFLMLPSLILERGLTLEQSAWILSVIGISDMAGRFFWGALIDLKLLRGRRRGLYSILGIMIGCVNMCFTIPKTLPGFILVAILWGLIESGFHGQRVTIQSEFIPKSLLPTAVGNMIFCEGLGNMLAPTIGGLLVDTFHTYRVPFYFGGIIGVTNCGLFFLDFLFGNIIRHSCKCTSSK